MLHDEWKLIYETYSKALYLYALSLTGNTQDAEELLQENFIEKMERLYEQADETLKVDIAKEIKLAKKGANEGKEFYGCSSFPKCRYTENL